MIQSIYKLEPVLDDKKGCQYVNLTADVTDKEYFEWMDKYIYPKFINGKFVQESIRVLESDWNPLPLQIANLNLDDFDHLYWPTQAHAYSKRAVDVLSWCMNDAGEILHLPCKGRDDIYYFNLQDICDVLDVEKSECHWLNQNLAGVIYKHAFDFSEDFDQHIFYIPQSRSYLYVTDKFKTCVEENDLKGFVFEEVWSRD